MMNRNAFYVRCSAIVSLLLLCTPLSALAYRGSGAGPGYGPGCSEPGIFRCISTLDLTHAQREDIAALQSETRAKILPLRRELQELEIPEALFAHSIDAAALEALLTRKKNINAEILDLRHEAMIAAALLLTPAQRTVLLEDKKQRPFSRGRGRGGPGRGGYAEWPDYPLRQY